MHLYEYTEQYRTALATLDDMDLPPEAVADTLEGLAGALEAKATNVAAFIGNIEADARAMLDAEQRIAARRKAIEARAAWLRDYLHRNMVDSGITEISCPEYALKVKQNPARVEVDDADAIPGAYMVQPETPPERPDKTAIKKALKAGVTVPGAHLERGTRLEIK